ncbi:hypothetical protein QQP08_003516 [Theobroma cacao]|nr:hypothetical protein QQP08_003516 [Theobroma cacao]
MDKSYLFIGRFLVCQSCTSLSTNIQLNGFLKQPLVELQDSDMKCNASAVVIFRFYSDNPYAQHFVTVKRSEAHEVAVACEYS